MDSDVSAERPLSGEAGAANGRPGDRIGRLDWLRFGPFLAQTVIVRRCNLSCSYCSEYDRTSEPVPFPELLERFRKLSELRTWAVCLTGGEPTLHPRLADLVAALRDLGFRRRQMITNGYRLTRELVESLNASGLTDLQISVDGVEPTRSTVKTLKPLRRRLEVLARHARFKVVMNAVIGSAPPEEALEVIDFAKDHGFIPRVLLVHDDSGQLNLSAEEREVYREVKRRIGRRLEDADAYRKQLLRTGKAPFKCRAGARYLYVDEHGLVHWCSQTRGAFTRALSDYSLDDLRDQFFTPKSCNETCTVGCVRTTSAFDEWRGQNLLPHQELARTSHQG